MKHLSFFLCIIAILSLFTGCGSSDNTDNFVEKFFSIVYAEKRPDILFNQMTDTMRMEIRSRKLSIFSSKEKLSEKYRSHSLTAIKKTKKRGRITIQGLIKEIPKRGRTSYRTFFAKFLERKDQSGESSWALYDLLIRKGKKPRTNAKLVQLLNISTSTARMISSITNKIELLIFDKRSDSLTSHLAKEFASYNEKNITLRFYNPLIERGTAESYGISDPGYMVVERKKIRYRIKFSELAHLVIRKGKARYYYEGERILAMALLRVSSEDHQLKYITGHGERSHTGKKFPDLAHLYDALKNFGFTLSAGSLTFKKGEKIGTLLFADPRYPLSTAETKRFNKFLHDGGRAIMLLEKPLPHTFATFLKKWGLKPLAHTIVDPYNKEFTKGPTWMQCIAGNTTASQNYYDRDKFRVLMADTIGFQKLKIDAKKPTLFETKIALTTSSNGWGEASFDKDKPEEVGFTKGWDVKGPIPLAATVTIKSTNKKPAGRLLIIGDSDFISNQLFQTKNSNWIFFRELINWLYNGHYFKIAPRRLYNSVRKFL